LSTAKELRELTAKKLTEMARKAGVSGFSGMKKEELVRALVKISRSKAQQSKNKTTAKSSSSARKPRTTAKLNGKAAANTKPTASTKQTAKSSGSKKAAKPVSEGRAKSGRGLTTTKRSATASTKQTSATAKSADKRKSTNETSKSASEPKAPAVSNGTIRNGHAAKEPQKQKAVASGKVPKPKRLKPERKQNPAILKKLREDNIRREQIKDLARATRSGIARNGEPAKDRIILIVRDSYWIQAYWEVTRATVERVQVALAENWHSATPTLRVYEYLDDGPTGASESVVRDIAIHGGVNNWYIPLDDPSKVYRVAIGYKTSNDRFHLLTRSNKVIMPEPGGSDAVNEHWTDIAEDYQRYFALSGGYSDDHNNGELQEVFETQLRRPMTAPKFTKFGVTPNHNGEGLAFHVEAEMIVFGTTDPNATVFLGDEPVEVQSDGAFAARVPMPDKRQVLPVVASSRDGSVQRTIVLAVERNTKVMEQVNREIDES
jgi:uncharacterized protein